MKKTKEEQKQLCLSEWWMNVATDKEKQDIFLMWVGRIVVSAGFIMAAILIFKKFN